MTYKGLCGNNIHNSLLRKYLSFRQQMLQNCQLLRIQWVHSKSQGTIGLWGFKKNILFFQGSTCFGACVKVRGKPVWIGSLLPPCSFHGLKAGHQAWQYKRLYPMIHPTGSVMRSLILYRMEVYFLPKPVKPLPLSMEILNSKDPQAYGSLAHEHPSVE